MPAIRFVFPHAPTRPVTINNGMTMRAWYDIFAPDLVRREDEPGLRASQQAVEALIARENQRRIASSNIVLAGFSQGDRKSAVDAQRVSVSVELGGRRFIKKNNTQ